ncbi:MAG: M81 family metallopeptidase, partial [Oscillatoriales cyanobacterium RU_3_3]|nr:M81 family metallopeptidase [Oscillatoriales cyanobacterium RU_3_3]
MSSVAAMKCLPSIDIPFLIVSGRFSPHTLARALPGGPVEAAVYQQIKQELIEWLRQYGAVDGFYLDLHG